MNALVGRNDDAGIAGETLDLLLHLTGRMCAPVVASTRIYVNQNTCMHACM